MHQLTCTWIVTGLEAPSNPQRRYKMKAIKARRRNGDAPSVAVCRLDIATRLALQLCGLNEQVRVLGTSALILERGQGTGGWPRGVAREQRDQL